ncbi:MAG: polyprenyl synthetase family protein [Clostridia bacterium]|nr:polyprenyl synthetase family protein [Clostridia bacterium]
MTDMNAYIKSQAEKINNRIEEHLKLLNQSIVTEAMTYSIKNGGKRIRPFLTLEFAKACGGNMDAALDFGCAVEMIHTYSLIHDDLPCMDNDDMRRGKPSCHKAFGEANALLAGDSLLTHSFKVITLANDVPSSNVITAVNYLSVYSNGMIDGQVLDLQFEEFNPTVDDVLEMYKLKTGCLLIAACQLGCLTSKNWSLDINEAARDYAVNLGLAFQIMDDILDITSDEATLGKPVGSDEKNDKSTIVKFYGLEKAKELVNEYTQKAIEALDIIDGDTSVLKEFALYMANRTY